MSEKTVFISYRRDTAGKYFARSVKEALTHRGYDVFLDVDCIDAGQWATQILTQVPKRAHFLLLPTPDAWRAAHRRLYEHLCATTPDEPQPTLEDLQPLYQAVAHGCQAGMRQEACNKVYVARILRGMESDGFYSTRKLGAFGSDLGAVVCFFEQPWSRISPVLIGPAQAWLLNQSAFRLRALGRLTEALEPMRAGIPIKVRRKDWRNAATNSSNLSELELTLGEVAAAVGDGEQSVTYADRSGDAVAGLRRAGVQDYLIRGLLTRAWLYHLDGQPAHAQEDLDEIWDIAARGPMKLFMADIHLHRARLFFREAKYPWDSPSDAEKLINACGYHRRDEELADARKVILS
jgi:hypothetical protein